MASSHWLTSLPQQVLLLRRQQVLLLRSPCPRRGRQTRARHLQWMCWLSQCRGRYQHPVHPQVQAALPPGQAGGGGDTSLIISRSCSGAAVLEFIITPLGACPITFLFLFSVLTPVCHAHASRVWQHLQLDMGVSSCKCCHTREGVHCVCRGRVTRTCWSRGIKGQ